MLAAALFWPALGHAFLNYDDDLYVTGNPSLQERSWPRLLRWAWTTGYAANWHPLTWMSHALDVRLHGLDPRGHHLTSVLLHALNAALLFLVLHRMTGTRWRSAIVAALFAVHPLHVESVAWVAERKDVLSTTFWLLTMLAYARHAARPRVGSLAVVSLLLAIGLTAKPMLVTLPVVLLLVDSWPLRRKPSIGEKVPLLALAMTSGVVTVLVQRAGTAVGSLEQYPLAARVGNALVAYVLYLVRTVWPADLSVFYPHPATSLPVWLPAAALLLLVALTWAAFRLRRRAPFLWTGWLWFVVTLLPVVGLVQVGEQAMADRYTYVPLIGIFLAAVWGVAEAAAALRVPRGAVAAAAVGVLLLLSLATRARLADWRDSEALFTRAVEVDADNAIARVNLAVALLDRGALDGAREHLEAALRVRPDDARAHSNLSLALQRLGRPADAERQARAAIAIEPGFAEAHNNLGIALALQGRADEAVEHFRRATVLAPEDAEPWYNWGSLLAGQKRWEEAARLLSRAIALRPSHAEAHYNLGMVLHFQGHRARALGEVRRATELGYATPPQAWAMLEGR